MTDNIPPRLSALLSSFDVFFFDQYGVLHDGVKPYPGAIATLAHLRGRGARVIVLSNSGRSGEENAVRMARIGIPRDLYDRLVTSGDAAASALRRGDMAVRPGETRCLTIAGVDAEGFGEELGLIATRDAAEADLVVIAGSQADRIAMDAYEAVLRPAAARHVPCLCTNPDKLMLTPNGLKPAAGSIARLYEQMGGTVTYFGKPHPAIYRQAAIEAGDPSPARVLCVGDSVEHDIVGAHGFGAMALLLRTGIHADLPEAELARECGRHGVVPDAVLPALAF
jgi:HAD superfamily hydrolase (TIGR01459 family)